MIFPTFRKLNIQFIKSIENSHPCCLATPEAEENTYQNRHSEEFNRFLVGRRENPVNSLHNCEERSDVAISFLKNKSINIKREILKASEYEASG
jgi:hypothetical protein